jgi:hypothetical protein
MNICDNSLLRAEAFLNSADKAATRFHDAHISAQAELTVAKLEWAKEPVGETWMQRCHRVTPGVSQSKIDNTVAGRFPKIVQEVAVIAGEGLEDRIRELMGDSYRTPEERADRAAQLVEVMAEKRAAVGQATGGRRNDCVDVTPAEKKQAARDEAVAIRVANGGAPAQQRTYSAPATLSKDTTRDDLLLLVIGKLRPLSVADLNEVNDLIDALTYPLRKQ